jgi:hypothetical protein
VAVVVEVVVNVKVTGPVDELGPEMGLTVVYNTEGVKLQEKLKLVPIGRLFAVKDKVEPVQT